MADPGERLHGMLPDYAKFLRERKLAMPNHQPHLVQWVREFLLFARQHGGYTHVVRELKTKPRSPLDDL